MQSMHACMHQCYQSLGHAVCVTFVTQCSYNVKKRVLNVSCWLQAEVVHLVEIDDLVGITFAMDIGDSGMLQGTWHSMHAKYRHAVHCCKHDL